MNERWVWVVRYAVLVVLALVLAAALGEMALFKTAKLGKSGLTAARLVQFIGYGGALLVLWLFARRAAALIDARDARWNPVKSMLLPLATLIAIAYGQSALLLVLGPLMTKAGHQAYNWACVAALVASAAWLIAALLTGSASLAGLFGASSRAARRQDRAGYRA